MVGMLTVVLLLAGCSGDGAVQPSSSGAVGPGSSTIPPLGSRLVAEWDRPLSVVSGSVVRVPWSSLDVEIGAINDSRCLATPDNDIACVWEGTVTVDLRFVSDGGATESTQLVGLMDGRSKSYGDAPTAVFDLVEVTAVDIADDGSMTLFFAGLD